MDEIKKAPVISSTAPQCQFFVLRKKRLCRMTVRPGQQYCGEHEPNPIANSGESDARIPCPNDPKHTCYASKLEKHLLVCNARQGEVPEYIVHNINAPILAEVCPRKPLSEIPQELVWQVIDKVDLLYEKHVKGTIATAVEHPIHKMVQEEFQEPDRTESSRRHLRQASSLLWLVEDEGLVRSGTCYIELGAGRGQLAYYAAGAWCAGGEEGGAGGEGGGAGGEGGGAGGEGGGAGEGQVLAVDRASPRHKRDGRRRERVTRLRADLAHLALAHAPAAARAAALVGMAKHLCGAATDYALRSLTAPGVVGRTRGVVLATCCHHRCDLASLAGRDHLQRLGLSDEELNIMLGVVSWATCGDGRSRERRASGGAAGAGGGAGRAAAAGRAGRRAKRLLDWARAQALADSGLRARLVQFVPAHVSPENMCIVASRRA